MTISTDFLLRITTPIAATIVSIAVAIISWKRWQISREKLRLDLFNRRFDIFQRVLDFHQELMNWKGSVEQKALYTPFIKAVRESRFIFPKKSGVLPFLEEFQRHSFYIVTFEEARDPMIGTGMNREIGELAQKKIEHQNWILNSMPTLEDKMEPYLRFERL
jgi:hypothetical protein